jgi:hypothetical protein
VGGYKTPAGRPSAAAPPAARGTAHQEQSPMVTHHIAARVARTTARRLARVGPADDDVVGSDGRRMQGPPRAGPGRVVVGATTATMVTAAVAPVAR